MTLDVWTAVDRYVNEQIVGEDDALREAIAAADRAGLPQIAVTPSLGKLLYLLARLRGARNVLEIGTLGGYSTIWLGRAVQPGGRVTSLEIDAKHAKVARENVARAGLADVVTVRIGRALDILPSLKELWPFDFVFIDADKEQVPHYYEWARTLTGPGALIIIDNVVRDGQLIDAVTSDLRVRGVRHLHELVSRDAGVEATTIQIVGAKGYDGMTIALVR
jgi:predicted O-methyltransferase YrrM